MNKTGVMICGHGSRDIRAVEEFASLQSSLAARLPEYTVEYGFLEFAKPIIRDGLDKLREQGINHVLAVPGMLFSAGHVKNDIASVLNEYQRSQNDPLFKTVVGYETAREQSTPNENRCKNDSELTRNLKRKNSDQAKFSKKQHVFKHNFLQVEFSSIFKSLFYVAFMNKFMIMLFSKTTKLFG